MLTLRSVLAEQEFLVPFFSNDTTKCFSVSLIRLSSSNLFPVRVVLDFGNKCIGKDGRIRSGKIITEYSNRVLLPGASAKTTFEDYIVNDVKIEGEHVITNKTGNGGAKLEADVSAVLRERNGDFYQWYSHRTITRLGHQTGNLSVNDSLSFTGSANGVVKKGDKLFQLETEISEPLMKKFTCRWVADGVITIKKAGTPIAVIHYGAGQCDNRASFTVLGHVREITLH